MTLLRDQEPSDILKSITGLCGRLLKNNFHPFLCTFQGQGVPQDVPKAVSFLKKAMEQVPSVNKPQSILPRSLYYP